MGKINQYPQASAINDSDTLLGVVGGTTKQVAKDVLLSGVTNDISNTTIVGKKAGKVVTTDDSSNNRLPEITAYGKSVQNTYSGKNLLNISGISGTTTWRGITHTLNDDKSITLSGTATELIYIGLDYNTVLSVGESYIVSISKTAISGVQLAFGYFIADGTYTTIENGWVQTSKTITIPSDYVKNRIVLQISSGATVNATIYPMIRKASITDDTYEPYVGGEASPNPNFPQSMTSVADDTLLIDDYSLFVKSVGKNLLENTATTQTINGITFTKNNKDKSMTLNGMSTDVAQIEIGRLSIKNTDIIFSDGDLKPLGSSWLFVHGYKNGVGTYSIATTNKGECKFNSGDYDEIMVGVYVPKGQTLSNVAFYPMIRHASIEDDTYEPYISSQANLTLADSLRGIPVTVGGNYTDEDGQAWICDTIEKYADGTGKLIKRVGHRVYDGVNVKMTNKSNSTATDMYFEKVADALVYTGAKPPLFNSHLMARSFTDIYTNGLEGCSYYYEYGALRVGFSFDRGLNTIALVNEWLAEQYANGTPMIIDYVLAEPIETDLTTEQMAELEKLMSFNPYTTVYTDDIGEIVITYFKNSDSGKIVGGLNDRISNLVALLQSNGVI